MKYEKKPSDTQVCSGITLIKVVHEAGLFWHGNLTRKWLTGAILLLVHQDLQFLGFSHVFSMGNEGRCLIIDRSTHMYHMCHMCVNWPASTPVQNQYTFDSSVRNYF